METTRTILTKTDQDDFDLFSRLYCNDLVMKMITGKALTYDKAQMKFELILKINTENQSFGYFGIYLKGSDAGIGMAKIVLTNPGEAEIGYLFHPDYWGKGFGHEISQSLVNYARSIQSLKSLIAIIDPENVASAKILIKSGFQLETSCTIDDLPAEVYRLIFTDNKPPRREEAKKF